MFSNDESNKLLFLLFENKSNFLCIQLMNYYFFKLTKVLRLRQLPEFAKTVHLQLLYYKLVEMNFFYY